MNPRLKKSANQRFEERLQGSQSEERRQPHTGIGTEQGNAPERNSTYEFSDHVCGGLVNVRPKWFSHSSGTDSRRKLHLTYCRPRLPHRSPQATKNPYAPMWVRGIFTSVGARAGLFDVRIVATLASAKNGYTRTAFPSRPRDPPVPLSAPLWRRGLRTTSDGVTGDPRESP